MLASLAFNATGGNNVILFLTRQHQIDGLHILRQRGAVSLALMLSLARYISFNSQEAECMKHRETKDNNFVCIFLFWGGRPGFSWHQ